MKTQRFRPAAMLPLFLMLALVGCDNGPDNSRPASAMPIQSTPTPPKAPPSTVEEKIAAIEASALPKKEKDAAIARVRSGQL